MCTSKLIDIWDRIWSKSTERKLWTILEWYDQWSEHYDCCSLDDIHSVPSPSCSCKTSARSDISPICNDSFWSLIVLGLGSLATLFRSLHRCLLDNFREDVEWILDISFQFPFQLSSANSKPFKMILGGGDVLFLQKSMPDPDRLYTQRAWSQ